jgi:hypothetical protein
MGAHKRDHHLEQFVYYSVSIRCYETYVSFAITLWFLQAYPLPLIRALASRCLAMNFACFQAPYHNINAKNAVICIGSLPLYCAYVLIVTPSVYEALLNLLKRLVTGLQKDICKTESKDIKISSSLFEKKSIG